MGRLVIGSGSGCCGTKALAKLLDAQPRCRVGHETHPILPWDGVPCLTDVLTAQKTVEALEAAYGDDQLVYGDVAMYYLNYIESILAFAPTTRVVVLRRTKEKTIRSYMRKFQQDPHWPFNHFDPKEKQIKVEGQPASHPWWAAFPTFSHAVDLKAAVGLFWDMYYARATLLAERYPVQVKLFFTHQLNDPDGVRDILNFVGTPHEGRVLSIKQ